MSFSIILRSIIVMFSLLVFFAAGIMVGDGTIDDIFKETYSEPQTECDISNLTLNGVATCLREEVSTFYYYNASNQPRTDLTLDELKTEGGVCYHYAGWYCDRAEELGFDCKRVSINVGDERHQYAIMSNEEGYCSLDQNTVPKCQSLDGGVIVK